jgi:hypothetical protein
MHDTYMHDTYYVGTVALFQCCSLQTLSLLPACVATSITRVKA